MTLIKRLTKFIVSLGVLYVGLKAVNKMLSHFTKKE